MSGTFDRFLQSWLVQRKELLVFYNALCLRHKTAKRAQQIKRLSIFRSMLDNYLITTHQKIQSMSILLYQKKRRLPIDQRQRLFHQLNIDKQDKPELISLEISQIGEALATCLDWEDALIMQCKLLF